jgi:hypothetical protein
MRGNWLKVSCQFQFSRSCCKEVEHDLADKELQPLLAAIGVDLFFGAVAAIEFSLSTFLRSLSFQV